MYEVLKMKLNSKSISYFCKVVLIIDHQTGNSRLWSWSGGNHRDFRKSHQSSQGSLLKKQWWIGAECRCEGRDCLRATLGCHQASEQGLSCTLWALTHMDTIWQAAQESFQPSPRNRIQEEMAASPSMNAPEHGNCFRFHDPQPPPPTLPPLKQRVQREPSFQNVHASGTELRFNSWKGFLFSFLHL